jgi:hypothetical protein
VSFADVDAVIHRRRMQSVAAKADGAEADNERA